MNDTLGDACKRFEKADARYAVKGQPLFARLDGRAFHTFTRGLARPFDPGMALAMNETTAYLIAKTHALVGFTQSDEITLMWFVPDGSSTTLLFGGNYQKLTSVLAGQASSFFTRAADRNIDRDRNDPSHTRYPHFDCRVWQVPTIQDAIDVFVWRQDDATKNSISMAAQAVYSDKQLQDKHSGEKLRMLADKGVDWSAYPEHFTRGAFHQRLPIQRALTAWERDRMPEFKRPAEGELVTRHEVRQRSLPRVRDIGNAWAVLATGADPTPRPPRVVDATPLVHSVTES